MFNLVYIVATLTPIAAMIVPVAAAKLEVQLDLDRYIWYGLVAYVDFAALASAKAISEISCPPLIKRHPDPLDYFDWLNTSAVAVRSVTRTEAEIRITSELSQLQSDNADNLATQREAEEDRIQQETRLLEADRLKHLMDNHTEVWADADKRGCLTRGIVSALYFVSAALTATLVLFILPDLLLYSRFGEGFVEWVGGAITRGVHLNQK